MDNGSDASKYVLIIGSMKCGTSSLYSNIVRHPEICPCVKKEPEYFTFETTNEIPYKQLWQFDPQRHRFALEASTGYTKFPSRTQVPQRIKAYGLDPYMIYIVRDPFARIESDFNYSMPQNFFSPAIAITDQRYVCISDYFSQLEEFRKVFGREKLLLLDFDDLVSRPNELANEVFEFIGLPRMQFDSPAEKKFATRKVTVAESYIYNSSSLNRLFWSLPRFARGALRMALIRYPKAAPKRKLTPEERAAIHEKLAPNMLKLQENYSFDVSKWGFG